MLHVSSYNMGRAAGITAKALSMERPKDLDEFPALEKILECSERLDMFFPSSYIEGFVSAWDYPDVPFAG